MNNHWWMKCCALALLGIVLIGVLSGCAPFARYQQIEAELDQAKAGLDKAVAELPQYEQLDLVHSAELRWPHTEYRETCAYARAYFVFGTQLPVSDVLDMYTRELQTLGWVLETSPRERSYMASTRSFIRGDHELLVIETGRPGFAIEQDINYEKLRNIYASLPTIRIDYILPQREEC